MYGPEFGAQALGLLLIGVFVVLAVLGFRLIGWALLKVSDRISAARGGALEDLRRRYASGEIDGREFELRRRRLLAH